MSWMQTIEYLHIAAKHRLVQIYFVMQVKIKQLRQEYMHKML